LDREGAHIYEFGQEPRPMAEGTAAR
jgi:hypothetical protein